MAAGRATIGLAMASHPWPTVAVTAFAALLSGSAGHHLGSGVVVTSAVFAGQLSIGWSNDLVDRGRDRASGRQDKPIARGAVSVSAVRTAVVVAVTACILLSAAGGLPFALVHLVLGVGSGWAYNLGLKATRWSAVPYAVAFGALPVAVWLALPASAWPPAWLPVAGALLGVGAHLLNALPDLADDARAGIRGLPHRLGSRLARRLALCVLLLGSAVAVFGPEGSPTAFGWSAMGLSLLLAAAALLLRGRAPFAAAMGIAGVNVLTLLVR